MSNTKKEKSKTGKIVKKVVDITLALAVAGGAFYGIRAVMNDFSDINLKPQSSVTDLVSSDVDKPDENSMIFVTEMADNEQVFSGPLTLVNAQTEYKGNDKNLISMYDVKTANNTENYLVMNADVKVRTDASSALHNMVEAFAKETDKTDIIIDGGYRSVEYQQELYDMAADQSTAAAPGTSDYHTGYSIDLGISAEDGTMSDFTADGDYGWFEKNCYKYGFVLRFPEGKKNITGYDYRPWHFRYVGVSHAYYMQKNNLCLEEYLEKLKGFEYSKTHLIFKDDSGVEYETYYYPADLTSSTSILAVPDSEYEISGNNKDGFIITFRLKSSAPQTEPTAETTATEEKQEEASEETTAESDISEENDDSSEELPEE